MNDSNLYKTCTKCKIKKPNLDFAIRKRIKSGLSSWCKTCTNALHKERYSTEVHKQKQRERSKKAYLKNKNSINKQHKKYDIINKEKIKERKRNYYLKNKNRIKERRRKYVYEKLKKDPLFKLKERIKDSIRNSFKRKNFRKNNRTIQILGCDFENFKAYIESKFETWMNWNNYGGGVGKHKENQFWDLDHIVSLSTAKNEEEVIKLNHYTNFQPLCSYKNRYLKKNNI